MLKRLVALSALFAVVALCAALPVLADTVITRKTVSESSAEGAGPPTEENSTLWIGDGKFAEIGASHGTVIDLGAKKMFLIDHEAKTFTELELPIDYAKIAPEVAAQVEQMVSQMKLSVEVKPVDESRKIGRFDASKYEVALTSDVGLGYEVDVWVTHDIDIDMTQWKRFGAELASLAPPVAADMLAKITSIDGFPVLQEASVTMMGNTMRSREELVAVEVKKAPAGTYGPPEGYSAAPFDPMAAISGRAGM